MNINRVIWIVLDSAGVGELPDAYKFGDEGSNTFGNIAKVLGGLKLKNMEAMGLGNITDINGVNKREDTTGAYGKLAEVSAGKDTTTGHWEMAGCISELGFPTYPKGFPKEIIDQFEEAIGTKVLGNKTASGTAILDELGEEHIKTGYPIVYTSADSVFQIAANEDIIPVEKLYEMCRTARKILCGKHAVARVIARPFIGNKTGEFKRTPRRHDFSLQPPKETVLDYAKDAGLTVCGVGKINDIFAGKGITEYVYTVSNNDGLEKTVQRMNTVKSGIIFTNLVDFDMLYGHRNDPIGYGKALEEFDEFLPNILKNMKSDDILIITADHGCDPTTSSTDHSREYIPCLLYGPIRPCNIGIRSSFADIGATIAEMLGLKKLESGKSFYNVIKNH